MFKNIFDIASSSMSANRLRINTIASNIANAQTTKTEEGGPYKRRDVVFAATDVDTPGFANALDEATLKNVKVAGVVTDNKPPMMVYDPGHPDADAKTGMVSMPNVNPVTEMVNMLTASAAYKAAAEIVNVTKDMANTIKNLASRL
ncbi:MAG: flagellar basal body rod protein FlgC [Proteobacteria bacterium]|nr:flagellar basal body rod protein FlgC [Pseudomonadota bacterium]